jgi:hypothetical protein
VGFDVSHHPLDLRFVEGTLLPALRTGEGLEELRTRALRLAHVRYVAKAWALGATKVEEPAPTRTATRTPTPKPSLLARLFGRNEATEAAPAPAPAHEERVSRFDSDLHVWGRPFLVTADDVAGIGRQIDTWLEVAPDDADELARTMLDALEPGLSSRVSPDLGDGMRWVDQFASFVAAAMDPCREVLAAIEEGRTFRGASGEDIDPAEVAAQELPFALLRVAAWFRPGWMDRGHVWPSLVLPKADVSAPFEPADLVASVRAAHPSIPTPTKATIELNYEVGGMLAADRVPQVLRDVEAARGAVEREAGETSARKLVEALSDAAARGFAFVEATEVYSGPEGVLN